MAFIFCLCAVKLKVTVSFQSCDTKSVQGEVGVGGWGEEEGAGGEKTVDGV